MFVPRYLRLLPAFVFPLLLAGCTTLGETRPGTTAAASQGSFHGGQQPVSGAQVQLYTVGTTGDGSAATPLLSTPAITLADGSFTFTTHTACPSQSSLVYLAATGGNPGLAAGTNNLAIAGLAIIGTCQDLANSTYLNINEATTTAAVSALAPFLTGPAAIGSAPSDAANLAAAFTLAGQFVNIASGKSPGTNLPNGYTAPVAALYTIADAIAPCINSSGTDSNCATLFSYTTLPTPANAPAPTDVVGALRTIALYPTQNIANIVQLAAPASPYQPILTQTPGTLALALVSANTTLSFSSVAFPSAAVGYPTAQQDLVVTNTGSMPAYFTATSFTIAGTNAPDFDQLSNCITLAPGAACDVLLIATPSANGTRTATLSPDANLVQPQSLALGVTGTAPSAGPVTLSSPAGRTISSTYYPYANRYGVYFTIGDSTADLTLTNAGTTPLTFHAPTPPSDGFVSVVSNTCVGTIPAGATCLMKLVNSGGGSSDVQRTLLINDDAAAGPQIVPVEINTQQYGGLSGSFPATPLGYSSTATFSYYLGYNSSSVSYANTITGPAAADYTPRNVTCSSTSSMSRAFMCTAIIAFTPSATGVRTAYLGSTDYFPLSGAGTMNGVVTGSSFTVPATLALRATVNSDNSATATDTLTLTNTGTTTATFPSFPLYSKVPGSFSQTNNCSTVASGASCTITLTYVASNAGNTSANLIVKDTTSGTHKQWWLPLPGLIPPSP